MPAATDALSRRAFTRSALGLFGGALFLGACQGGKVGGDSDGSGGGGDSGGGDSSGSGDSRDTVDSNTNVEWATGGTAAMSGSYADPFGAESSCAMTCAMTLGPCYGETVERQDISEGYTGLPVRLALKIVDESCEPVKGMVVDIWHASLAGLYSGADTSEMCTDGDRDMITHQYFRGRQTTDASGRVDFDTCFPGWYSGRAVHVHFQVRTGATEGSGEYVTSQLFFEPTLIQEVFANHPEYSSRGQPDTPNSSDKVLGNNDPAPYTLTAAKQADGALLAWKTIVIRSSLSEQLCTAPESGR
ncbi:MAG TPA: protocatechuate 3,4-dioxygenase [Myxococcota bacterium]|nr:protocatechuate 3,4-dioxygenase [Myxococcota bacterium]